MYNIHVHDHSQPNPTLSSLAQISFLSETCIQGHEFHGGNLILSHEDPASIKFKCYSIETPHATKKKPINKTRVFVRMHRGICESMWIKHEVMYTYALD